MKPTLQLTSVPFNVLRSLVICLAVILSPVALAADSQVAEITAQNLVDINQADAMTLADVMDGVGLVKAQAIIDYREQIGRFQSLEQLLDVSGIGMATLEKNRHLLTVSSQ